MDFYYKLLNYLIQGSAADDTKEVLIRYDEHPKREGRMLVAVHDEANISVLQKRMKPEMQVLREVIQSVEFDVPMLSDGETGPNWGSLVKFEEKEFDMKKWLKEYKER
jgi:DNA polymerase I-like protein with 3'-5' exonuclease and polymerase domains